MIYSHIIWDFNGTLLDDVQTGIDSVNVLLRRRGIPVLESIEQYRNVFGFPVIDYYRRIGFDLVRENFDDVAVEWVDEYKSHAVNAKLFDDAEDALHRLSETGVTQLLLSATESYMLSQQLDDLEITKHFTEIIGLGDIYAGSKIDRALMWKKSTKTQRILMIGDTVHDFDVATALEADCILVSRGHQSTELLIKTGAKVMPSLTEAVNYII